MEAFGKKIIWIDETNFNLFCSRQFGRASRGSRARIPVASSKGRNVHLIGAISIDGVLKYTIKRGSFTADLCRTWMEELIESLPTAMGEGYVVVCDNAPCHSRLESVFTNSTVQLLRLGPYSPALNPIEHIWSTIKQIVKTEMRSRFNEMILGDPQGVLCKQEWRLQFLESIIHQAKSSITPEICSACVRHVRTLYASVLVGGEI